MKLLFIYYIDVKIFNKTIYCPTLDQEVLDRYKKICSHLTWATSVSKANSIDECAKFNPILSDTCKFIHINKVRSIKGLLINKFNNKKILEMAIREHDNIIIRVPSSSALDAIKLCNRYQKPYMLEIVGCPWDAFWNHSIKGKIVAPFMFYFTKKAVKKSPYVLYVSNEFLQHRYPSKGKTLGCSDVSLPPLDESILERRLNKINQMSDERPIVLGTVAAVNVRYKGQEYVIKAISKLNEEGYNFEYYLVGGGDNDYLKSVAEKYNVTNKVKFLGSLPHDQVFEFMKDIDIYIQPSNAESHGRVIVEAMQTACPVIGSSTGGIPELVSSEFVFKRKNLDDLIVRIKRMTKEKMVYEAKRSFEKSKEFEKSTLDSKRNEFYMEFKNSL